MGILILGASGMLGNTLVRYFARETSMNVFATVRSSTIPRYLNSLQAVKVYPNVDVENQDCLVDLFSTVRPKIVINAIGLVKQLASADEPLIAVPINTMLPHRLARLCALVGSRLIHISTDCVFSGRQGMYTEDDQADAYDLYGRTKLLGEVAYPHALTIRTSMIGHELSGSKSLISWFLSQKGKVNGYRRAVFSGLPTVEIARVIHEFVLPHIELHGVYHLSATPIDKYELLNLVAKAYGKLIEIIPDDSVIIDRSLDSSRFREATGFIPKSWDEMIIAMMKFG
jgi:dTDP-4-dehydrorhamnose reductase